MPGKSDLRGTGKVYAFTLAQYAKSKSNIITTALILLFALFSLPVMSLFNGSQLPADGMDEMTANGGAADSDNEFMALSTVYIDNQTSVAFSADDIHDSAVTLCDGTPETKLSTTELQITLSGDTAQGFSVDSMVSPDSKVGIWDTDTIKSETIDAFNAARMRLLGVSEEQLGVLYAPHSVTVEDTGTDIATTAEEDDGADNFSARFALQYAYAFIVLFLCMFSSIFIIRAIVEEKASKLVELLMVSVRPLALIIGKILAVMTYIFGLLLVMLAAFAVSGYVTTNYLGGASIASVLENAGIPIDSFHIGIETILIALVSLMLAYLTISIFGGISGTCCSTMEDVESANSAVVLLVMAGYFVCCFTTGFDIPVLSIIVSLCPIVSIFCAPVQFVFGNISIWILLLSWLIQICLIAFLSSFCARIYADLLIYKGERVRLKRLLGMARSAKTASAGADKGVE